jgi:hypothetical protein
MAKEEIVQQLPVKEAALTVFPVNLLLLLLLLLGVTLLPPRGCTCSSFQRI